MFEVRELDNDASFLRNYLTRDLVEELDLYLYRLEGDKWVIVEKDWEVVRDYDPGEHDQLRPAVHRRRGWRLSTGARAVLEASATRETTSIWSTRTKR